MIKQPTLLRRAVPTPRHGARSIWVLVGEHNDQNAVGRQGSLKTPKHRRHAILKVLLGCGSIASEAAAVVDQLAIAGGMIPFWADR
jgi:hypothetical protein